MYTLLSGAVGTSDEYAMRPAQDRSEPYPKTTVYVGNVLADFDAGVAEHRSEIEKPEGEVWIVYAGTLGASYDLATLIEAASLLEKRGVAARVKILGDGPDRKKLEELASELAAPVDFLGYMDYPPMAAYLDASDITAVSYTHLPRTDIPPTRATLKTRKLYGRPSKPAVIGVMVTVMTTITKLGAQPTFTMSPKLKYLRSLE